MDTSESPAAAGHKLPRPAYKRQPAKLGGTVGLSQEDRWRTSWWPAKVWQHLGFDKFRYERADTKCNLWWIAAGPDPKLA